MIVFPAHVATLLGYRKAPTLGQFLFLVFINDLPAALNECAVELFADDALLHCQSSRKAVDTELLAEFQYKVQSAEEWAMSWHGRFGPEKTSVMSIIIRSGRSVQPASDTPGSGIQFIHERPSTIFC